MQTQTQKSQDELGALFDTNVEREFAARDVDATMETMTSDPYVYNVSSMIGGFGRDGVYQFYSEHFISQIPKDAKVTLISRTVSKNQLADELILSFTHDAPWDYLLPGVAPTGKHVELAHVVVATSFENGKIASERIYWDQASLLVQIGLLDPANLPVTGAEQAKNLLHIAQQRKPLAV